MTRLLSNGALNIVEQYQHEQQYLGFLINPAQQYATIRLQALDLCIGVDNAAFSGFNEKKYRNMLSRLEFFKQKILFVTAPDVVGNHIDTLKLFNSWYKELQHLPIAFVLQDGVSIQEIPFNNIDALFVGGSTEFKLSAYVQDIMLLGKSKNKYIHVGRVNSIKREALFLPYGMDSFDGTTVLFSPEIKIPKTIMRLKDYEKEGKNAKSYSRYFK